jgi:hypothetical protein
MRLSLFSLALLAAGCVKASATTASAPARAALASSADSAAVAAVLVRSFDALRVKNVAAFQAEYHPAARFTLIRPVPNMPADSVRPAVLTLQQFIGAALGPQSNGIDEPVRNVVVAVNGPLAMAWAEYQVRANGVVTHCGYDAFHLIKQGGAWKILNVADSFQREGCGPIWP